MREKNVLQTRWFLDSSWEGMRTHHAWFLVTKSKVTCQKVSEEQGQSTPMPVHGFAIISYL